MVAKVWINIAPASWRWMPSPHSPPPSNYARLDAAVIHCVSMVVDRNTCFFLGHLNLFPTRQWDLVVVFFVPSKIKMNIKWKLTMLGSQTARVLDIGPAKAIVCSWFKLAGIPAHIPRMNRRRIDNKYRCEIRTKDLQALGPGVGPKIILSGVKGKTSWTISKIWICTVYCTPTISFVRGNSLMQ